MVRPIRRRLVFGLGVFLGLELVGCTNATPPACVAPAGSRVSQAPAQVAADIGRVLDDWHKAAAQADEARYFSYFAPSAVFLGTDRSERWDVRAFRAFAHPYFAKGKAWSFTPVRRDISVAGDGLLAWFDEDLETPNMGPARGSGVLLKLPTGAWRIAHYNLALTVPNERMKAVKRLIAGEPPESSP